jgi:hypothetical protein
LAPCKKAFCGAPFRDGEYLDQALWTIIRDGWMQAKTVWGSPVIH